MEYSNNFPLILKSAFNSIYFKNYIAGGGNFPPVEEHFKLLDGTDFLLFDGTNFNLFG